MSVTLERVAALAREEDELRKRLIDAWLFQAPKRLAAQIDIS